MPHPEAVAIITAGSGQHFDPDVVDAFLAIHDTFQAIAKQFADDGEIIENMARKNPH